MSPILETMHLLGIVPVVVLDDAKDAPALARAMAAGGIPCAEITLRTAAGLDSIAAMAALGDEILVGAGSVITLDNCKDALSAGARFIVSPGFNPKVVEYCRARDVAVLPGCVTPTEIMQAMELGLDTVKFFPANVYGGLGAMKALSGPFPGIKFVPTGGVNEDNLAQYLAAPFIQAIGGSWLCAQRDIKDGQFEKITALCRQARQIVLGYEVAHIGINSPDPETATAVSQSLQKAFDFPIKVGSSSQFVTPKIEVMNSPYLGEHGHMAIATNSLPRALADLKARGFEPAPGTEKYKDGAMAAIYLQAEVGGFALHLLQR